MSYDQPADREVEEISSLCMNCHEEGVTRLLLTQIPFFRDVVLMSFSCPHCHFQNSEIQSAGEIQQRGVKFSFKVSSLHDLQRQIVKSDTCVVRVEDVDLEIPAGRGQLTNLEGLLSNIKADLEESQPARQEVAVELYEQLEGILQKLASMLDGSTLPFTISLDDPAGNSSIEPSPQDLSGNYSRSDYARTVEQNAELGLGDANAGEEAPASSLRPEYQASDGMYPRMAATNGNNVDSEQGAEEEIVENQVYSFPSSCPGCAHPCTENMKMVRIPHFKEVVIMATVCDSCGYRSNEVKTGGEVPVMGRRITLKVNTKEDLSRDILKAESASLGVPELSLDVQPGTLGGRFTTIEGLLVQVRDDLRRSIFQTDDVSSTPGDSMPAQERASWNDFFSKVDRAISGDLTFTMVLEDPMAASYVQSFTTPEPDGQIQVEDYQRSKQEEDDLGLSDMKTEDYEDPVDQKEVSDP